MSTYVELNASKSRRCGKPRIRPDAALTKTMTSCVAADELLLIKAKANDIGLSVSQFIRYLALEICDETDGK